MIKLLDLLIEQESILIPRRSPEERRKNHLIATQKKIQQYIKDGGKGDLYLKGTPITSLPQGLNVEGNLNLQSTPITSLPQDLKVGGYLDLENTPITSLPQDLKVGGSLDLQNTPITSLPQGLTVGGELYLKNTPLSKNNTIEQIKTMAHGVKGDIFI